MLLAIFEDQLSDCEESYSKASLPDKSAQSWNDSDSELEVDLKKKVRHYITIIVNY